MECQKAPGGFKVKCIKVEPFEGKKVAPPLELNKEYTVKSVIQDKGGNSHYDVGLVSEYEYITSIETGEELPDGDTIHWCHPSRFELI